VASCMSLAVVVTALVAAWPQYIDPLADIIDCRNNTNASDACGPAVHLRTEYDNNYCLAYEKMLNGSVDLLGSLAGMVIDVIIVAPGVEALIVTDSYNRTSLKGLTGELIASVALAGNFKYRAIFVKTPDDSYDNDYDIWMLDWLNRGDLVTTWFLDSPVRRAKGVVFPYNFYELNHQLVTHLVPENQTFDEMYLLFMFPFTWGVWAAILGLWCLYGLCMSIIEGSFPVHNTRSGWTTVFCLNLNELMHDIFFAAYSFVSQGGYIETSGTRTRTGYMLAWLVEFGTSVLLALYTANMASIFTAGRQEIPAVTSLQDVFNAGGKLCYRQGTQVGDDIEAAVAEGDFPSGTLFPLQSEAVDNEAFVDVDLRAMDHVRAGDCLAYALPQWVAEESLLGKGNEQCDMRALYPPFGSNRGGYITADVFLRQQVLGSPLDFRNLTNAICASLLVPNALGALLREVTYTTNQPILQLRAQHLELIRENKCQLDGSAATVATANNFDRLGFNELGAMLVLLALLTCVLTLISSNGQELIFRMHAAVLRAFGRNVQVRTIAARAHTTLKRPASQRGFFNGMHKLDVACHTAARCVHDLKENWKALDRASEANVEGQVTGISPQAARAQADFEPYASAFQLVPRPGLDADNVIKELRASHAKLNERFDQVVRSLHRLESSHGTQTSTRSSL